VNISRLVIKCNEVILQLNIYWNTVLKNNDEWKTLYMMKIREVTYTHATHITQEFN
jgi:hypothetical protein